MKYLCREYPYLNLQDIQKRRLNYLLERSGSYVDAIKGKEGKVYYNNEYTECLNEEGNWIGVNKREEGNCKKILFKDINIQFINGYFETEDKEVAEALEEYNKVFHNNELIEKVEG